MKQTLKPDKERDLAGIIKVLKANIAAPSVLLNPDTCFTKAEMAFLVEILENHARILELIKRAEQDIHQQLQTVAPEDYVMNRLTVLKNDIKERREEVQE